MRIDQRQVIPFPREVVFAAYRDEMPSLVPYLPNIRDIRVVERRDEPPLVHLISEWKGGAGIPAFARAFVSDKLLTWTDHARWDGQGFTCAWRIQTHAYREAIRAEGENRFEVCPEGTTLVLAGELEIDGRHLPVPRLMQARAASTVARFLGALIGPNLASVGRGLARYLAERGGATSGHAG